MKCHLVALACLLVVPPIASADDSVRSLELFSGMESGDLDVVMVAPSPRNIYLRVTNNTREMVNIELPDSFLGVPVLAQFQPPGGLFGQGNGLGNGLGFGAGNGLGAGLGNGMGNRAGQGNSSSQALGGGFQQGGMQGIGNGLNGIGNGVGNGNQFMNGAGNNFQRGMFRVPAGRTSKVSANTVCLEFGKPDPNSLIKYRIVPLKRETGVDARLITLCQWIGQRRVSPNVAQAIAWHLTDKLSWQQLAELDRVRSKYTGNEKFFQPKELEQAMRIMEHLDASTSIESVSGVSLSEVSASEVPSSATSSPAPSSPAPSSGARLVSGLPMYGCLATW